MTRDEILAMKPGRELDALVAEKVMNWKYFPAQVTDTFVRLDYFFDPVSGEAHHHWSPSADISAAWEVVEKMSEQWPQYQLAKIEDGWSVMWGFDGYGWPEATGKTAPEAICKAALLAVMEGEKDD